MNTSNLSCTRPQFPTHPAAGAGRPCARGFGTRAVDSRGPGKVGCGAPGARSVLAAVFPFEIGLPPLGLKVVISEAHLRLRGSCRTEESGFCLHSGRSGVLVFFFFFCKCGSLPRTLSPLPLECQGLAGPSVATLPASWTLESSLPSSFSLPFLTLWSCPYPHLSWGSSHVTGPPGTQPRSVAYNGLSGAICNNSCNSLDAPS